MGKGPIKACLELQLEQKPAAASLVPLDGGSEGQFLFACETNDIDLFTFYSPQSILFALASPSPVCSGMSRPASDPMLVS